MTGERPSEHSTRCGFAGPAIGSPVQQCKIGIGYRAGWRRKSQRICSITNNDDYRYKEFNGDELVCVLDPFLEGEWLKCSFLSQLFRQYTTKNQDLKNHRQNVEIYHPICNSQLHEAPYGWRVLPQCKVMDWKQYENGNLIQLSVIWRWSKVS